MVGEGPCGRGVGRMLWGRGHYVGVWVGWCGGGVGRMLILITSKSISFVSSLAVPRDTWPKMDKPGV